VYTAAFIYTISDYDDEFHRLNALIDAVARSLPDYLGSESWISEDGKKNNSTYYWSSLESLKQFSTHPQHLEAKRQYSRWYEGFHIVVSEVMRSYGDGGISHITPNERKKPASA